MAAGLRDAVPLTGTVLIVPDAHLLFCGVYTRLGLDLVLSKDGHEVRVSDYFKGQTRLDLASIDGARLSANLVSALVGEVQVAQLGAAIGAAQVIGTVTKLVGDATAIRNGVSIQLNMGDKVNKGDVVQAGADSALGITFIDGTVFGLSANARMVLNEMVYDPNGSANSSLLSLVQGTITFVAGETAKRGDMRVETPVATMGIRGTAVLVEIGFEVPGQAGAPPVRFHVLAEPGGQVGSYLLYSRANPSEVIATVNTAGLVTSVTGTGNVTTAPAPPFSPEALSIITPIFQLYFPTVPNPRSIGPGGGSSSPQTVPDSDPLPQNFNPFDGLAPDVPRVIPINLPNAPLGTSTISVTFTRQNSPPTIETARFGVSNGGTVVLSEANIGVVDSESSAFTFTVLDVAHGRFETSVDGVHWLATATFTTADLSAGRVRFVHDGSATAPTFSIQADDGATTNSHGNIQTGFVEFSALDQHPVITDAVFTVSEGGVVVLSASNFSVNDSHSSAYIFSVVSVAHGSFQVSADGMTWSDAASFTAAQLNARLVRFLHDGSELEPTFSIQVDDGLGTNHQSAVLPGRVAFNYVNDPPAMTLASIAVAEGGTVTLTSVNFDVSDSDSSTVTLMVSDVRHGTFQVSADGVHWDIATHFTTTQLDRGQVRFVHDGSDAPPTFSIQADDGAETNHASSLISGSVVFTSLNDVPVVTNASLTVAEGGTAIMSVANFGVSDSDSSAFTFGVSGVTNGAFQTSPDGTTWRNASEFTTAQLDAGRVRFLHDGGEAAPAFFVRADDGHAMNHTSGLLAGIVDFSGVNDAPAVGGGTSTATIELPIGGLSAGAAEIAARPGLISGIGTATGYGVLALPTGDDNSSAAIDITSVFGSGGLNFFGTNYTSLYINNNGNLTFEAPNGTFTPSAIDAGLNEPIIAAFWGDVDTRGTGHVYYTLDPVDGVMTITWDEVGYFNGHSGLTNSFQIVLLNGGGGNFDIQLRYADIQWTTGDASGGIGGLGGMPARAGVAAGDGVHYYELPESGDQSALLSLPESTGGTGVTFEVDSGEAGPSTLTAAGSIDFSDPDLADTHTASVVAADNAVGTLTLTLLSDTTGAGTGGQYGWTYNVESSIARMALRDASNSTLIENFEVTIDDGHGGTVRRTVSVTLSRAEGDTDNASEHNGDLIVSAGAFEAGAASLRSIDDALADHGQQLPVMAGSPYVGSIGQFTANQAPLSEADTFTFTSTDGAEQFHRSAANTITVSIDESEITLAVAADKHAAFGGGTLDNFVFANGMSHYIAVASDNVSQRANDTLGIDELSLVPIDDSGQSAETELEFWVAAVGMTQSRNETLGPLGDGTLLPHNDPSISPHIGDFIVGGPLL